MFLGDYEHSLDDKNRVVLPSQLRRGIPEEHLHDRFYIVRSDEDECLELHPRESWDEFVGELKQNRDRGHRPWREFLRDLYSSASELQLDKQYRFLVPEANKNAVGIDKDLYFVGMGDFIEIWARDRWEKRCTERAGKRVTPSTRLNRD